MNLAEKYISKMYKICIAFVKNSNSCIDPNLIINTSFGLKYVIGTILENREAVIEINLLFSQ